VPLTLVPELKSLAAGAGPAPVVPPLVPPPRFGQTDFAQYRPQHSSQQQALQLTRQLAAEAAAPARSPGFTLPWRRQRPQGRGLYLDGSFGVGKTHLLAATFNASPAERKAYLSFQELVWLVGVKGLQQTREFFAGLQLLCLDEFELDDPGNTLIVRAVLQFLFAQGTAVLTTSNTPPDAQGEGRFDAAHFQREIQSIAERFTIQPLIGPDYRQRPEPAGLPDDAELAQLLQSGRGRQPLVQSSWDDLFTVLRSTHPIGYRPLLADVGTLFVTGVSTIPGQSDALRFVHFIDKLYDLQIGLRASGSIGLAELFAAPYRRSGYRKKHERCISRLGELIEEPLD
jgi:cell division protein ZapE